MLLENPGLGRVRTSRVTSSCPECFSLVKRKLILLRLASNSIPWAIRCLWGFAWQWIQNSSKHWLDSSMGPITISCWFLEMDHGTMSVVWRVISEESISPQGVCHFQIPCKTPLLSLGLVLAFGTGAQNRPMSCGSCTFKFVLDPNQSNRPWWDVFQAGFV